MSSRLSSVVVVGGGVAAHRCVFRLREQGYEGRITLLTGERLLPYDRTGLSKALIVSHTDQPRLLSPRAAYEQAAIDVRTSTWAQTVLPQLHAVRCADGTQIPYDRLVLATGAVPIVPEAFRAPGIHMLRSADDLRGILASAATARRVAIIGAGLIGCELASSLRAKDRTVTLIERGFGPLAEIVGAQVAQELLTFHRRAGIHVMTATVVRGVARRPDRTYELAIEGRQPAVADCVVVAVGARPATDWLLGTGLADHRGILTNEFCETAVPGVLAAGDCAAFLSRRVGHRLRFEHWYAAARHGVAAADNALGKHDPFDPVPFFWSDQHGSKLAMAGTPTNTENVVLLATTNGFTATYPESVGGEAVFGLNATKAVVALRRDLEARLT